MRSIQETAQGSAIQHNGQRPANQTVDMANRQNNAPLMDNANLQMMMQNNGNLNNSNNFGGNQNQQPMQNPAIVGQAPASNNQFQNYQPAQLQQQHQQQQQQQ